MGATMRLLVGPICGGVLVGFLNGTCRADGGTVRAITRDGRYQIAVFTSPAPLVAGVVDISVLVQDAETLAALPGTPVSVSRLRLVSRQPPSLHRQRVISRSAPRGGL